MRPYKTCSVRQLLETVVVVVMFEIHRVNIYTCKQSTLSSITPTRVTAREGEGRPKKRSLVNHIQSY